MAAGWVPPCTTSPRQTTSSTPMRSTSSRAAWNATSLPCWSEISATRTARGYPASRVVPVLRRVVVAAVPVALVAAAVASAATGSSRQSSQDSVSTSLLMPGVTYSREVDFTSRGPIVLDVVTAPKPDGKVYSLAPALSNNSLTGREALTSLDSRVAAGATSVAIDGDITASDSGTGAPSGILMQNGVLESSPAVGRSSLGIAAADGTLIDVGPGLLCRGLAGKPASAGRFCSTRRRPASSRSSRLRTARPRRKSRESSRRCSGRSRRRPSASRSTGR